MAGRGRDRGKRGARGAEEENERVVAATIAHAYLAGFREGYARSALPSDPSISSSIAATPREIDDVLDAPPRGFHHAEDLATRVCDAVRREPRSPGQVFDDARDLSNRARGLVDAIFGRRGGGGGGGGGGRGVLR